VSPAPVVLVVDDDPHVRASLRWALEDEGLAVETAADGREAVERAAARPPTLVLLDLTLPVLDSYAAARALRAGHGAGLPILAITPYPGHHGGRAGASEGGPRRRLRLRAQAVRRRRPPRRRAPGPGGRPRRGRARVSRAPGDRGHAPASGGRPNGWPAAPRRAIGTGVPHAGGRRLGLPAAGGRGER
jgi:CheY-like chemotaxis protein